MTDNSTPHRAAAYVDEVRKTIPLYEELVAQVVDVAIALVPYPRRWLDTGTGTGFCVTLANERVNDCHFVLADPADSMLAEAQSRLGHLANSSFISATTAVLPALGNFDVITAVQCHHYGGNAERKASLSRCWELLRPNGVIVTSENIRAEKASNHVATRRRWQQWLQKQGKSSDEASAQLAREDVHYFPIRPSEHLELMQSLGLVNVEMVFRSFGQAIFIGCKPC